MHKQTVEFICLVKEFDQLLSVLFSAERRFDIKKRVFRWIDKHFLSECKTGKGLESFPVFNEAVFEYGLWVAILFGEGGVEIDLSFFRGGGIGLNKRRYDSVRSLFASESHFGVEGSDFHNQWNSILMIKTLGDIHS